MADETTITSKATTTCWCGCGGRTKSRFVPGHDARFHSRVKQVIRGTLDADEALAALPHEPAREAFLAYGDKIEGKEAVRKAKEEAKAQEKADKLAAKEAAKLARVEETVEA